LCFSPAKRIQKRIPSVSVQKRKKRNWWRKKIVEEVGRRTHRGQEGKQQREAAQKEEKRGNSKNDEAPVVLRTLTSHSGEEVWPGESTSVRRADGTAHF